MGTLESGGFHQILSNKNTRFAMINIQTYSEKHLLNQEDYASRVRDRYGDRYGKRRSFSIARIYGRR